MNSKNILVLTIIPQILNKIWKSDSSENNIRTENQQARILELENRIASLETEKKEYIQNKLNTDQSCKICRELFLRDFQLHRSIFDSPVDIIIFAVDQHYRYTAFSKFYNEAMKRIFHTETKVGMSILDHIDDATYRSIAKTNIDRTLKGEYFIHYEEFIIEENPPVFYNCYHSPIRNTEDQVIGVMVFMVNLTDVVKSKIEAMRSEEKLIASEERYRTIADNINDGILYAGENNEILYVSPSYVQQLGYDLNEEIYSSIESMFFYIHPDEKEVLNRLFSTAIAGKKKKLSYSYRIRNKAGEYIWREDNTQFKYDESGTYSGLFTISRDITDRKNVEVALNEALIRSQASNRLRTAFIQNISHEVRTPLNGILGFGELLSEPGLSDELKEQYYQMLNISSIRLLNTITDYMDAALIESGSVEVNPVPVNLHKLIFNLIPVYQELCKKKKIDFILSLPDPEEEITIITDPEILRKCIAELLDNAIKFTDQGSVSMGYTIKDQQIDFYVKDSGIGISTESAELIFEPFRQEIEDKTLGYEGNGLGLSITRGFLNSLGGSISLQSEKGQGSCFFFSIPLKSETKNTHQIIISPAMPKKTAKLEILIAEDDLMSDLYMEISLKPYASKIYKATNGIDAVQLYRDHPGISLVLIDLKMPLMNGFEATREIKTLRKDVLVIAVTAYALIADKKAAFEAGVDDFMAKPVSKADLIAMLDRHGLLA